MLVTYNTLMKFLQQNVELSKIVTTLNSIGFEVESVNQMREVYSQFRVAQIKHKTKHENAEKLNVCQVDDGSGTDLQIVCGASNVRDGLKTVLAPINTNMPGPQGFTIKAAKIRGITSNGMMCSAEELLLPSTEDGIIELPDDAPVGVNFAHYSGYADDIIDISITPNRGDALSAFGLARDLAAALDCSINIIKPLASNTSNKTYNEDNLVNISIKDNRCTQFAYQVFQGITNRPSNLFDYPELRLIGSSLKTVLVDISNYMMYLYGRPNHFYDLDKIKGEIAVRASIKDEEFIAIGGTKHILPAGLLVIADEEKILSVAGVMGGELSKVTKDTKRILVEVAHFTPETVVISGRALNLNSDSRYRFERNVDASNTDAFLEALTAEVLDKCGGAHSNTVYAAKSELAIIAIPLNYQKVRDICGIDISDSSISNILSRLGFIQNENNTVTVPHYRAHDISTIEDLSEEVIRIYGYSNVESKFLNIPVNRLKPYTQRKQSLIASMVQVRLGLQELVTWSFMHSKDAMELGLTTIPFTVTNPISSELDCMRTSLIPNLLNAMAKNIAHGNLSCGFFELGPVYDEDSHLKPANLHLSGIRTTQRLNFSDVKTAVMEILRIMSIDINKIKIQAPEIIPPYYHPTQCAVALYSEDGTMTHTLAIFGMLHPKTTKRLDTEQECYAFEVFYDTALQISELKPNHNVKLPALNPLYRDLGFTTAIDLQVGSIVDAVIEANINYVIMAEVFDIYKGPNLPENKKSVAIRIKIQPLETTLTDAEIKSIYDSIIKLITTKFDAEFRLC